MSTDNRATGMRVFVNIYQRRNGPSVRTIRTFFGARWNDVFLGHLGVLLFPYYQGDPLSDNRGHLFIECVLTPYLCFFYPTDSRSAAVSGGRRLTVYGRVYGTGGEYLGIATISASSATEPTIVLDSQEAEFQQLERRADVIEQVMFIY